MTDDITYASRDDWVLAWQPAIEAIGRDFSSGPREAIDEIERGAVRRYCEPLEFDCPLHHDAAVARRHGHRDIVAPWSGIPLTWTDSGQWRPGEPTRYPDAMPHALNNNARAYNVSGLPMRQCRDQQPRRDSSPMWKLSTSSRHASVTG
jgi:hypothetical protein